MSSETLPSGSLYRARQVYMRQRFRWDSFEAEEIWRENDVCSKEGGGEGVGVLKAIVDINLNAVLTLPFKLLRPIYFSFTPTCSVDGWIIEKAF